MSLILNALKKSEADRKGGTNPSVQAEPEIEEEEASGIRWTTVALAILLVATVGAVGVIKFLPSGTPPQEPETIAENAPEAASPAINDTGKTISPPVEKVKTENPPAPEKPAEPEIEEPKPEPVVSATTAPRVVTVTEPEKKPEPQPVEKPAPVITKPAEAPVIAPIAEQPEPIEKEKTLPPITAESVIAKIAPPRKPPLPDSVARAADLDAARLYLKRAEAYEESGQTDLAIEAYGRAIENDENFAEAYFGRGWAHEAMKAHESAIRDFTRAAAIRPAFSEAFYARAWANEQIGNTKQAILDYGATLRLQPDHLNASLSRGILQFYAGEMGKAGEDFQNVQNKGTKDLSDFGLLWLYLSRARSNSDITSLKTSFAGMETQTEWPGILFRAFIGTASPEQVINAMNTTDSLTTRKRQCVGFFFLGQLRLIQGNVEGARKYFTRALETKITSYRQYWAAKIELQRMGSLQ